MRSRPIRKSNPPTRTRVRQRPARCRATLRLAEEITQPHSPSYIWTPLKPTGLVYDQRMTLHKHEWSSNEQETPMRIQYAFRRCQEEGVITRCVMLPARKISEDALLLVHSRAYIQRIKRTRNLTRQELYDFCGQFDGVFFNEFTWDSACLAAGSLKHLADQVVQGRLANGFAFLRPPGHHAMYSEACGYCILNNVAVVAATFLNPPPDVTRSSQSDMPSHSSASVSSNAIVRTPRNVKSKLDRILILDWDVHHGQGTQYAFYNDKRVLFISIHRYENAKFWPNLREANFDFIGEGDGLGYNVNIPVEEIGLSDSDYLAIFHQLILPIAFEFNPQLVIVSCGFDAAIGCPEGRMWLTPAVYGHFIHYLKLLAGGKLVVALEGGYYVDSLAEGAVHVIKALLGDAPTPLQLTRPPSKLTKRTIDNCVTALRSHWKSLWVHGISKTVDRPLISHLPVNSWPIVRRIVWPETNPILPDQLKNQVTIMMEKYLPVPAPPPSHHVAFFLAPASFYSADHHMKFLNSLKGKVHLHLYRDESAFNSARTVLGKRIHSPESPETSAAATKYSKLRTGSRTILRAQSPLEDLRRTPTRSILSPPEESISCGCSFATVGNPLSKRAIVEAPDMKTALNQTLNDLFLRKFNRALVLSSDLNVTDILEAVTDLAPSLLRSYRLSVTRTRTGRPPPSPISRLPQRNNMNTGDTLFTGENRSLSSYPAKVRSFPMSILQAESVGGNNKDLTVASRSWSQGTPVCRVLVVDLTGSSQTSRSSHFSFSTGGHMKSDVVWCSIYHGEPMEHSGNSAHAAYSMVSRSPKQKGDRIRFRCWFDLPVVGSTQPECSSTMSDMVLPGNLLALMIRVLLPIAYEFAPDLVCFKLATYWTQMPNAAVHTAVAQLLHLLSSLGAPVILCHGTERPPSSPLVNCLLGRSFAPDWSEVDRTAPSLEMQSILRSVMSANGSKWKNLRFTGSLPLWRQ